MKYIYKFEIIKYNYTFTVFIEERFYNKNTVKIFIKTNILGTKNIYKINNNFITITTINNNRFIINNVNGNFIREFNNSYVLENVI